MSLEVGPNYGRPILPVDIAPIPVPAPSPERDAASRWLDELAPLTSGFDVEVGPEEVVVAA